VVSLDMPERRRPPKGHPSGAWLMKKETEKGRLLIPANGEVGRKGHDSEMEVPYGHVSVESAPSLPLGIFEMRAVSG